MSSREENYKHLINRDGTQNEDVERKALFYILGGNEDLYGKIEYIYDFKERAIKTDCLEGTVDLSSGSLRLVKLAFNLYNGYPTDVFDTFAGLDEDNRVLAIEAIKIRFSID